MLVAASGCAYGSDADGMEDYGATDSTWQSKLHFNLDPLNADGLQGPSGGLRALHYEYCIPDQPGAIRAVSAIDPTLEIQQGPPPGGLVVTRAGCCAWATHTSPITLPFWSGLQCLPWSMKSMKAFLNDVLLVEL